MNISQYAKTAASIAGGIAAWGVAIAVLFEYVPNKWAASAASIVLLIVHVAQSFSVWLTKNEPLIDAAVSGNPVPPVPAALADPSAERHV